MKKTLPIAYPPITSFPGYANALAILLAHPEAHDWVYSHYIQINTIKCENKISKEPEIEYLFFVDSDWDKCSTTWSGELIFGSYLCPFLRCYSIPSEILLGHTSSFSSFVKESLEHDMYIKVFVDASKIDAYHPCAPGFAHDILIYGYGDEQALFSDFLSKHGNKYSNDYAAFPQLDLAYQTLAYKEAIEDKKEHSVALIKVNPDIEAPADMRYVIASVKKYLFPSETSAKNLYQHFLRSEQIRMHRPIKTYEGVDVYHYLSNYAYSLYNHGLHYVDIRLFHAMSDHKKMMLERMQYFIQKGLISEKKHRFIDLYETVYQITQTVRNKIIKSNFVNAQNPLHTYIANEYEEAKCMENEILTKFFLES